VAIGRQKQFQQDNLFPVKLLDSRFHPVALWLSWLAANDLNWNINQQDAIL